MVQIYRLGKPTERKIKKLAANGLLHMYRQYILTGLQRRNRRLGNILSLVVGGVSCSVQHLPPIQKYGNILVVMKGEKE